MQALIVIDSLNIKSLTHSNFNRSNSNEFIIMEELLTLQEVHIK